MFLSATVPTECQTFFEDNTWGCCVRQIPNAQLRNRFTSWKPGEVSHEAICHIKCKEGYKFVKHSEETFEIKGTQYLNKVLHLKIALIKIKI